MDNKCPHCDRHMHLDAVRFVSEYDHSALVPGKYHKYHCSNCRRSFHILQAEKKEEVYAV